MSHTSCSREGLVMPSIFKQPMLHQMDLYWCWCTLCVHSGSLINLSYKDSFKSGFLPSTYLNLSGGGKGGDVAAD